MTGLFMDQSSALTETLQSMRDVPGLQGSFVVSDLGRLLARDMPALFADDVLAEVGPRALRLRDTMGDGTDSLAWCVVRYPTNVLCMRPLRDGLLIVLTESDTNLPALRMAMSHSIRRLNALLDGPAAVAGRSAAGAGHQAALGRNLYSPTRPQGIEKWRNVHCRLGIYLLRYRAQVLLPTHLQLPWFLYWPGQFVFCV
jgi:predicted regulator of Ras-like GTPase activity (Roadblock/LC7/MglB family)